MNPNCQETHATFRIVGRKVDPDTVTTRLGLKPDMARAPGTGPLDVGIWSITSEGAVTSTSLENHINALLARLQAARPFARGDFDPNTRFEFHCYWMSATGHGGPVLSSAVVRRIASLDADLDFDFYCAEEQDELL